MLIRKANPCYVCGHEVSTEYVEVHRIAGYVMVVCPMCGCHGKHIWDKEGQDSKVLAIDSWNNKEEIVGELFWNGGKTGEL